MTLESGSIISYPYLWRWQHERGEDAGRKRRPTCITIVAKQSNGRHEMILLPTSSQAARDGEVALEIPQLECQRIGIGFPAWITVSEFNYDILEQSFYVEPALEMPKKLSTKFLAQIIRAFLHQKSNRIDRTA
jgi:hypothetical protein